MSDSASPSTSPPGIRALDRPGLLARVQKIFSRPACIEQAGKFWKTTSTALSLATVVIGAPLSVNVGHAVYEHFSGPKLDPAIYATQVSVAKDVLQRGLDGLNTSMDVAIVRDRIEHLPRKPDNLSWVVSIVYALNRDEERNDMSANMYTAGVTPGVLEESACLIMTPKNRNDPWVEEGLYARLADRISRTYDVPRFGVIEILRSAHTSNRDERSLVADAGLPGPLAQQIKLFAAAHIAGHEAGHCVDLATMTEDQRTQIYIDPEEGGYRFESVAETVGLMAAYRIATAVEGGAPPSEVQKWVEDVAIQRIKRNNPESFVSPSANVYAYRNAGFAALAAIEAIRAGEKTADDPFSRDEITENIERGEKAFLDQDRQLKQLVLRTSAFEPDDPSYALAERIVDEAFSATPQRCDYVGDNQLDCAPLPLFGDEATYRMQRLNTAFKATEALRQKKEKEDYRWQHAADEGDEIAKTSATPHVSVSLGGGVLNAPWDTDKKAVPTGRLKH